MRLLVDSCVAESVYDELLDAGYDAEWTGDWDEDAGDREILRIAHTEGRIVVTLDKDFGELAVRQGVYHCGIVRLKKLRINDQAKRCIEALESFGEELQQGSMVVVEPGRIRWRPASKGS